MALLFLWPLTLHPNFVPFHPGSQFSDLLITHLPNAEYIRDSLARYGQWPLWNAQILAGQPFAADPLAGMWYPPNLLLLILPLPFAFNLLFALHFAWAGYGQFVFLRDEGLHPGPALLGGLAFAGTPKLVAHLGAGHVSLVFAVAWTPWLLLAVKRAAMQGGLRRGALAGVCLALLFLADVRWAFYSSVLSAAFWMRCLLHERTSVTGTAPPVSSVDASPLDRSSSAAAVAAALAFAGIFFSLSAVLAFPLGGFILQSGRRALTLTEAAAFSLPPRELVGLVIPHLGGNHEWMTYVGVIPLLLALAGVLHRLYFWSAAVLVAVAFSLGANFVLFPVLFQWMPGLGFLRVPPRAWFIVALGVSLLAAHGAQWLVGEILPRFVQRYADDQTSRVTHHLLRLLRPSSFLLLACLFTLADLLRVDATLLEARPRPERTPAARWIAAQPGLFRVYSPSYSLPLGDGLQHVDGVSPLQLASSVRFIEAAIGIRARSYSVTVPAFESDDPNVDISTVNAKAIPDAQSLGLLNVKYVAAEFPIHAAGLTLVQILGQTRVYENAELVPRARVVFPARAPADGQGFSAWVEAEVQTWSPNRIVVQADGPGTLLLSEVMVPGWEARVDGALTPIVTVDDLFRSVPLTEGHHEVVFDFRPRSVLFGAMLSLAGLAALALIWRREKPGRGAS